MTANVGVNVQEVDGRAVPVIAGAPTSVAAFVGVTERGPADSPARLTNLAQFRERFGAHRADSLLPYAVDGFFANGGTTAYVSRVVGAGSEPASTELGDRTRPDPGPTLRVTAGTRGRPDPGRWGNRLRIDVTDDPRGRTRLTADTAANATSARLESLAGTAVGSVLRLVDGPAVEHRRVETMDQQTRTVTWTGALAQVFPASSTVVTTAEFRLTVRQLGATSDVAVTETWSHLSMEPGTSDYAVGRLNNTFTGSRLVLLTDLSGTTPVGVQLPAVVSDRALTGGSDSAPTAADFRGSPATRSGLNALDTAVVQLLAIPDVHVLGEEGRDQVVRAALDYCAGRGDVTFVGSVPDRARRTGVTVPRALTDYRQTASDYAATTMAYAARFHAAKVYGALYTPWIRVADPVAVGPAPARFVPADGHVMGVFARTDAERGIAKAPAGLAAQVRGAVDVAARFTDAQHTDLVRTGLVNGIRPTPGAGIVVSASRTLSTDTRWWFVSVRLLFNFVKVSLRDGLRFVRQEPHSEQLRRSVRFNVVTPFLMGLWRQGAFGSDPPELTFTVKCDGENNPPGEVDQGNFRVDVSFYPVKPAETVLLVVGQQPGGGSARET